MPLLNLIATLMIVGVLLWVANTWLPMDARIRTILNAVVIIAVILWLLRGFGMMGPVGAMPVAG